MKLNINVSIYNQKDLIGTARKDFETDIQPFLELVLQDDAWEGTRKIKSIIANFNIDRIILELEEYYVHNNEDYNSVRKNFISNGWNL
ncbi:MAG: hypothetical protein IPM32_02205 [Ignavibacteriae bacterium]|nr:hypothetical protein [Ignavibacteriota bacterium]